MFLSRELSGMLVGGRIRNIKQIDKTFYFEIFKEKRFYLKVVLGSTIFVTQNSEPGPLTPSSFCMQLRKHLIGKQISSLIQHEFDRIVGFHIGSPISDQTIRSRMRLIKSVGSKLFDKFKDFFCQTSLVSVFYTAV